MLRKAVSTGIHAESTKRERRKVQPAEQSGDNDHRRTTRRQDSLLQIRRAGNHLTATSPRGLRKHLLDQSTEGVVLAPIPEYDKQPYQVENDGKVLRMTSEISARMKYRIRKEFSIDKKDGAFVITYSIINESDETRKVAPWEVTRVENNGGIIFFDAPVDSIWPAGLMDFKQAYGAAWYQPDETGENRKVNADGKGWLAYCNKGLLLVKRFEDITASQPAPDEAEIQVYVNRGKAHIELESQGAYTTLKPQEQLTWTVRWYLLPYQGEPVPSAELLQKALKNN